MEVEKSEGDDREYRVIVLDNELVAMLVSDKDTDLAAAALDVNVGHFSDPDEVPGLAHFLEHMLFLGTKKYPDENSFSEFLSKHGGKSNAYTAMENTNFMFDVSAEFLEEALDRFSQFFTDPLFTESATLREMQAVDNEHSKNLQNDGWRQFQLLKSTSRLDHPFSKFGSGNMKTLRDTPQALGIDVRAHLLKFHSTLYSANIMKLAVVGKNSLDVLETWVRENFSDVRNLRIKAPTVGGNPFQSSDFGVILVHNDCCNLL